jgi:acyl carrier protein
VPEPDDIRPDAVRAELTDILVQVVGCARDDVVDRAKLKDLGVDSLAIVEMADELGRRFGVYLADETVNGMRTVADAVAAVVHHDGNRPPRSTTYAPAPLAGPAPGGTPAPSPSSPIHHADPEEQRSALRRLAVWFAVAGAAVGIVFGLVAAGLVGATGLSSTTLPPLTQPTTPAPTAATSTPTPTPTPTDEETVNPDPTLTITKTQVSPGERFTLEGQFPGLDADATLQVQVKDPGASWDDFPVTTKTRADGKYKTQIYTSRTGEREFRLSAKDSDKTTPAVKVTIG